MIRVTEGLRPKKTKNRLSSMRISSGTVGLNAAGASAYRRRESATTSVCGTGPRSSEESAELAERAHHAYSRRSLRAAKRRSDLLVRKLTDDAQREGFSLRLGERVERRFEVALELARSDSLLNGLEVLLV